MSNTHAAPETVMTTVVVGEKLYGGTANPNYADPKRRNIRIRVSSNDKGQCLGYVTDDSRTIGTSPVLPDRAAAEAWVSEVSEYASSTLTGQIGEQKPAHLFDRSHSLCATCGGIDTVRLSQEAWVDRITCVQCDDESVSSIGD